MATILVPSCLIAYAIHSLRQLTGKAEAFSTANPLLLGSLAGF